MPTTVSLNDQQGIVFFLEPNMKVGIKEIDQDNDRLFQIINRLNLDLEKSPYSREQCVKLFRELLTFGIEHFDLEEKMFQGAEYCPVEKERHRIEHRNFIRTVMKLLAEPELHPMKEVLSFLNEWLNEHILKTDKKFAQAYLSQHSE